ncbi:MAG TPA: glycosyltransferase [Thermoanaerobaculia bacterium]|jgi:glycosyltransferase involved in cell wall biosynthesis|nr:glycosyltransferase [Thermoanaerobaculia bacterium]
MPRVSIIIPVYNGANYMREAIDSALAQTSSDEVEVIVVNDGSRDGGATAEIARSYGDRIRYVEKENGGVSSALNRGIAEMHGRWFSWLSHDDRYLPSKIATQLAFLDRNPEARIVGCNFEIIDEHGDVTGDFREHLSIVRTGREVLSSWVYGCGLMIDREALIEAGLFNESNRTTQDLEMWLRLVERNPIHLIPDVLAQFRRHSEAGSQTETRYQSDKDELFARILDRYDAAYFDPAATTSRLRADLYWFLAVNAMSRESWGGARVAIARAWREWPSPRNPALKARIAGPRTIVRGGTLLRYMIQTPRAIARRVLPDAVINRLRARKG